MRHPFIFRSFTAKNLKELNMFIADNLLGTEDIISIFPVGSLNEKYEMIYADYNYEKEDTNEI